MLLLSPLLMPSALFRVIILTKKLLYEISLFTF